MRKFSLYALVTAPVGIGVVLTAVAPGPGALPAQVGEFLRHPQATVDARGADLVALTIVAAAAWLTLAWLIVAILVVAASALPGWLGGLGDLLAGVLVPAGARQLLATALGVTLLTGAGAGPAVAAPGPPPPPVGAVSGLDLDWPAVPGGAPPAPPASASPRGPVDPAAAPTSPTPPGHAEPPTTPPRYAPAAPASPSPTPPASAAPTPPGAPSDAGKSGDVLVRPGDSLWRIAASRLGGEATDARIAREWPRWWAANRHVVGDDPDLILPGQRLSPPPIER